MYNKIISWIENRGAKEIASLWSLNSAAPNTKNGDLQLSEKLQNGFDRRKSSPQKCRTCISSTRWFALFKNWVFSSFGAGRNVQDFEDFSRLRQFAQRAIYFLRAAGGFCFWNWNSFLFLKICASVRWFQPKSKIFNFALIWLTFCQQELRIVILLERNRDSRSGRNEVGHFYEFDVFVEMSFVWTVVDVALDQKCPAAVHF